MSELNSRVPIRLSDIDNLLQDSIFESSNGARLVEYIKKKRTGGRMRLHNIFEQVAATVKRPQFNFDGNTSEPHPLPNTPEDVIPCTQNEDAMEGPSASTEFVPVTQAEKNENEIPAVTQNGNEAPQALPVTDIVAENDIELAGRTIPKSPAISLARQVMINQYHRTNAAKCELLKQLACSTPKPDGHDALSRISTFTTSISPISERDSPITPIINDPIPTAAPNDLVPEVEVPIVVPEELPVAAEVEQILAPCSQALPGPSTPVKVIVVRTPVDTVQLTALETDAAPLPDVIIPETPSPPKDPPESPKAAPQQPMQPRRLSTTFNVLENGRSEQVNDDIMTSDESVPIDASVHDDSMSPNTSCNVSMPRSILKDADVSLRKRHSFRVSFSKQLVEQREISPAPSIPEAYYSHSDEESNESDFDEADFEVVDEVFSDESGECDGDDVDQQRADMEEIRANLEKSFADVPERPGSPIINVVDEEPANWFGAVTPRQEDVHKGSLLPPETVRKDDKTDLQLVDIITDWDDEEDDDTEHDSGTTSEEIPETQLTPPRSNTNKTNRDAMDISSSNMEVSAERLVELPSPPVTQNEDIPSTPLGPLTPPSQFTDSAKRRFIEENDEVVITRLQSELPDSQQSTEEPEKVVNKTFEKVSDTLVEIAHSFRGQTTVPPSVVVDVTSTEPIDRKAIAQPKKGRKTATITDPATTDYFKNLELTFAKPMPPIPKSTQSVTASKRKLYVAPESKDGCSPIAEVMSNGHRETSPELRNFNVVVRKLDVQQYLPIPIDVNCRQQNGLQKDDIMQVANEKQQQAQENTKTQPIATDTTQDQSPTDDDKHKADEGKLMNGVSKKGRTKAKQLTPETDEQLNDQKNVLAKSSEAPKNDKNRTAHNKKAKQTKHKISTDNKPVEQIPEAKSSIELETIEEANDVSVEEEELTIETKQTRAKAKQMAAETTEQVDKQVENDVNRVVNDQQRNIVDKTDEPMQTNESSIELEANDMSVENAEPMDAETTEQPDVLESVDAKCDESTEQMSFQSSSELGMDVEANDISAVEAEEEEELMIGKTKITRSKAKQMAVETAEQQVEQENVGAKCNGLIPSDLNLKPKNQKHEQTQQKITPENNPVQQVPAKSSVNRKVESRPESIPVGGEEEEQVIEKTKNIRTKVKQAAQQPVEQKNGAKCNEPAEIAVNLAAKTKGKFSLQRKNEDMPVKQVSVELGIGQRVDTGLENMPGEEEVPTIDRIKKTRSKAKQLTSETAKQPIEQVNDDAKSVELEKEVKANSIPTEEEEPLVNKPKNTRSRVRRLTTETAEQPVEQDNVITKGVDSIENEVNRVSKNKPVQEKSKVVEPAESRSDEPVIDKPAVEEDQMVKKTKTTRSKVRRLATETAEQPVEQDNVITKGVDSIENELNRVSKNKPVQEKTKVVEPVESRSDQPVIDTSAVEEDQMIKKTKTTRSKVRRLTTETAEQPVQQDNVITKGVDSIENEVNHVSKNKPVQEKTKVVEPAESRSDQPVIDKPAVEEDQMIKKTKTTRSKVRRLTTETAEQPVEQDNITIGVDSIENEVKRVLKNKQKPIQQKIEGKAIEKVPVESRNDQTPVEEEAQIVEKTKNTRSKVRRLTIETAEQPVEQANVSAQIDGPTENDQNHVTKHKTKPKIQKKNEDKPAKQITANEPYIELETDAAANDTTAEESEPVIDKAKNTRSKVKHVPAETVGQSVQQNNFASTENAVSKNKKHKQTQQKITLEDKTVEQVPAKPNIVQRDEMRPEEMSEEEEEESMVSTPKTTRSKAKQMAAACSQQSVEHVPIEDDINHVEKNKKGKPTQQKAVESNPVERSRRPESRIVNNKNKVAETGDKANYNTNRPLRAKKQTQADRSASAHPDEQASEGHLESESLQTKRAQTKSVGPVSSIYSRRSSSFSESEPEADPHSSADRTILIEIDENVSDTSCPSDLEESTIDQTSSPVLERRESKDDTLLESSIREQQNQSRESPESDFAGFETDKIYPSKRNHRGKPKTNATVTATDKALNETYVEVPQKKQKLRTLSGESSEPDEKPADESCSAPLLEPLGSGLPCNANDVLGDVPPVLIPMVRLPRLRIEEYYYRNRNESQEEKMSTDETEKPEKTNETEKREKAKPKPIPRYLRDYNDDLDITWRPSKAKKDKANVNRQQLDQGGDSGHGSDEEEPVRRSGRNRRIAAQVLLTNPLVKSAFDVPNYRPLSIDEIVKAEVLALEIKQKEKYRWRKPRKAPVPTSKETDLSTDTTAAANRKRVQNAPPEGSLEQTAPKKNRPDATVEVETSASTTNNTEKSSNNDIISETDSMARDKLKAECWIMKLMAGEHGPTDRLPVDPIAGGVMHFTLDHLNFQERNGIQYSFFAYSEHENCGFLRFSVGAVKKLTKTANFQLKFLILRGELQFQVNGKEMLTKGGDFLVLPENSKYSIKNGEEISLVFMIKVPTM
ncbi:uncharacterized protein LOC131684993 isoform X2 [Topomyia yanbarensis]|uniref:uncharacterized protein LOC131684993 isoform X2 n=1 Tax=Topomyia yanbarensis TaxID=2498891 RepID=UPI00273B87EB|nr:uncharacterized protein LOC131684993 isoform X2 [Topomyia yanbarensis]